MHKKYIDVDSQIELLESRGMSCDAKTAGRLMREGYYAIVNGYGKPFLDDHASLMAHEDRYVAGTEFAHVHALFSFDRTLRVLTFRELMRVEATIRAVAASAFLESHQGPEDYLDAECYSTPRHYLLGEQAYERNLRRTIDTMSRLAHEHEEDDREDARLAHYRDNYDYMPLWVLFSDFSFGNLFHFVALMRRNEQLVVCERLGEALGRAGGDRKLTRQALVEDMSAQVEVRNMCAHGERLYDARVGMHDEMTYAQFARMLQRYLVPSEWERYSNDLVRLVDSYLGISATLDNVLESMRIKDEL